MGTEAPRSDPVIRDIQTVKGKDGKELVLLNLEPLMHCGMCAGEWNAELCDQIKCLDKPLTKGKVAKQVRIAIHPHKLDDYRIAAVTAELTK